MKAWNIIRMTKELSRLVFFIIGIFGRHGPEGDRILIQIIIAAKWEGPTNMDGRRMYRKSGGWRKQGKKQVDPREREREGDPDDLGALFALCCCWLMFLTLISHSYGYTAISHRQSRRTQPLSKPLAASSSRLLLLWVLPKRKKEDNKEEYNTRAKEKKKKAQIRKHVRDTRDFVVTEAMTGYAEHIQQTEHWKLKVESVGNIRGQWEKKMPALYWSARLGLFFFFLEGKEKFRVRQLRLSLPWRRAIPSSFRPAIETFILHDWERGYTHLFLISFSFFCSCVRPRLFLFIQLFFQC